MQKGLMGDRGDFQAASEQISRIGPFGSLSEILAQTQSGGPGNEDNCRRCEQGQRRPVTAGHISVYMGQKAENAKWSLVRACYGFSRVKSDGWQDQKSREEKRQGQE
jgi:hypothetical protein